MKIWQSLKAEFKLFRASITNYVYLYLLFPIGFALVFGFIYSFIFTADFSFEINKIYIEDQDQTQISNGLINVLSGEEMDEYVEVVEEEEADYILTIPQDFSDFSKESKELDLKIKQGASHGGAQMLEFILDGILSNINQAMHEQDLAQANALSQEELASIQSQVLAAMSEEMIETKALENTQAYTSYEYYGLFSLWFILMNLFSASISGANHEQFAGLRKRVRSLPLSAEENLLSNFIFSLISAVIFAVLYILIARGLWGAFDGNILHYLFVFLLQAAVYASLGSLIGQALPQNITNVIVAAFTIFIMFLGGLLPVDALFGEDFSIPAFLTDFAEQLSVRPYFSIHNGSTSFIPAFSLIAIILTGLILVLSLMLARKRKEY